MGAAQRRRRESAQARGSASSPWGVGMICQLAPQLRAREEVGGRGTRAVRAALTALRGT